MSDPGIELHVQYIKFERVMNENKTRCVRQTKCTIRIFTIDGDLIRELEHDCIENSPGCMHEEWDMITRNTQAVVSGIYYYSVESEQGNQIGKLVIIM